MIRHGRAAFVALHLFAVTAMALPSAGAGLNRAAWADPTVQGEFQGWAHRLSGLGITLTVKELEDQLWAIATGYEKVRVRILAPFEPYYVYCGTWQSWRMFVAPHRYPGRLEVHVDHGGGREPLFIERSNEHTWRRRWMDHDRMRASIFRYSWKHYSGSRRDFTDWVAAQVAKDDPQAQRVRVSFMRYRTPSPQEVLSGVAVEERRELSNTRDTRQAR